MYCGAQVTTYHNRLRTFVSSMWGSLRLAPIKTSDVIWGKPELAHEYDFDVDSIRVKYATS